jgi:hypothetical protein
MIFTFLGSLMGCLDDWGVYFYSNTPLLAEGMKGFCINLAIDQLTGPDLNAAARQMPRSLLAECIGAVFTWIILDCYYSQDSAHHFSYFSTDKVLISG